MKTLEFNKHIMNIMKIPVDVENTTLLINVNTTLFQILTCKELIRLSLIQISYKNKTQSHSYALFESINGIERLINKNENILKLCLYNIQMKYNFRLLLRKYRSIERKLLSNCKYKYNRIQLYKKLKNSNEITKSTCENKCDIISDENLTQQFNHLISMLKKRNEEKLDVMPMKLENQRKFFCDHHENQLQQIISEKYDKNALFIKYLRFKLKVENFKMKFLNNGGKNKQSCNNYNENSSNDTGYLSESYDNETWV